MKKIIDRRVYNTDTAEEVASWSNGYSITSYEYWCEALYRTRNGAWFLWGEGGARSAYGRSRGRNLVWGEDIRALDDNQACDWLIDHGFSDEAIKWFESQVVEA